MKQFAELVQLLGKDFELCNCNRQHDTPLETLYTYLQESERPTAAEAAAAIGLDANDAGFRKIKHRLKLRLINSLTEIHTAEKTVDRRKRQYAYVWKLVAIGKQLRTSVGSTILLPYLREAYQIAEATEMVEAAYQCATMLRRQYVNRHFDPEKYQFYTEEAARYRRITRCYQEVVADYNHVTYLRNTRAPASETQAVAREAFHKHGYAVESYDLAIISYLVFLLELNIYLLVNDWETVIRVARASLRYLEEKPTAQPTMFHVFEANLTVAYTQLNDYERGTAFARELLAKTEPTDFNYLKVYELLLILALRAGRYQEAYETFMTIRPETLTKNMLSFYYETFRIIEAYLYLLVRMGQITTLPGDRTFERFRINRFLNSFQYATAEKNNRNIHLMIIEIVNHVLHRRHNKTVYSIEAITKYASRHLRGKAYERVRYFLKALAQLATQQFHRSAVERHTTRYIKLMQQKRLQETHLDFYLELIPYEDLWGMILDQLGYKRIRLRQTGSKDDE